ncbi:MAG: hypothetical protein WC384_06665 [Prolixibacteraceae bacterium]|jgi:hypothetical protein
MRYTVYFLIMLLFVVGSCKNEDESKGFPSITTLSALEITTDWVVVKVEILMDNQVEIEDHGFVYSPIDDGNEESYDRVSLEPLTSRLSFSI